MELAYRTRGMSDPRGKPKVFFSCHPADFTDAFDLVVEDVLWQANCVIWYDASLGQAGSVGEGDAKLSSVPDGELLEELDGMQLIVFAITSRFLEEANRARDVELPHALARHIPVLPIMLENGLEYEFNEKCAPVQVVNRNVDDSTATPYEEVLRAFLNSVLVGDELAEKVRDAFDAYVFLSYRKKDRRHAKRLMHLIHENERFRDIAIWYDEYLVPGEGFDKAIEAAFRKSSLFALSVTPNLLEEGNYVMDVEFPMARRRSDEDCDMEIVPVEMYDPECDDPRTDLDKLEAAFEGIPSVVDEHAAEALDSAFVEALERVGKSANDGSPQHCFFVGLAYLNGIDVEPNYERARELIEQAASDEHPCIEATEKLVDMYSFGEGVERNLTEAIRWQRMVVDQYTDAYRENHDPDEHRGFGTKAFKALARLSDLMLDAGNVNGAISVAEAAYNSSHGLVDEVGQREVDRDKAVILNKLGTLYRSCGKPDKALDYYWRAQRIYANLASVMMTARARRDLSVSYERIGDVQREKKDLTEAEECYRKSDALRRDLVAADPCPRTWRDRSVILTKLGNVCADGGGLDRSLEFYQQALDLDRQLFEELRTSQASDDYSVSLIKMGDIAKKRGDHAGALTFYEEAEGLYEGLARDLGTLRYRSFHARSLGKLASAYKHVGDVGRAESCYAKAEAALSEIVSAGVSSSDVVAHDLAAMYFNHALLKHDRGLAQKAITIWEELSSRDKRYERYLAKAKQVCETL